MGEIDHVQAGQGAELFLAGTVCHCLPSLTMDCDFDFQAGQ